MLNKMQLQTLRTLVEQASHERLHALVQSDKVPAQDAEYQFYQELLGELKVQAKLDDGWISVDDMLPIDEGFVLLLKDDGDIAIGQYVFDLSPFLATTEFYQNQDYDWIADLNDVTHWQPLPNPVRSNQ